LALADDLLQQAKHLARRELRRPRQASLRRAVSAAYYAVFHRLIEAGSRVIAPARPPTLRAQIGRAFAHGDMKVVCRQFRPGNLENLSPHLRRLIEPPLQAEVAVLARVFIELQDARNIADYDLSALFTRFDALEKLTLPNRRFMPGRPSRARKTRTCSWRRC
jgi:hypothetical protein